MSKYTTQLRWVVENYTQDTPDLSLSKRIENALPKIFNFDYPIWNKDYRAILEKKIIMHYINKEIGFETLGLWKLYLEEKLNLIMPYYNKLYETTVKDYDWMSDTNIQEVYTGNKKDNENINFSVEGEAKATTTGTGKSTSTDKNLKSDLPQANYQGVDYGTGLIENEGSTDTNSTSIDNSSSSSNSTNVRTGDIIETNSRTRKGVNGSNSMTNLLMEYRDSLINIDKMIIDELHDLFMLIY